MNKQGDTKGKIFSGFFWRFLERSSYQIITLCVTVLLQRLLEPEMYGIVSKVTVITAILLVFVDSGMANALIQKKDPDDLDFSSVFYFNIVFCLFLYLGLYALSPWLAVALKEERLIPVMRVLGLTVLVSGLKNVQEAYVRKTMQFRLFFRSTIGGTVFSGALGIFLALQGYGVWALVWQQLSNVAVNTLILWFTVGWRPKRMFSWQRLGGLFHYGVKLLGASLLDVGYQKIYPLIIGVTEGNAEMAFFEKGQHYPNTANDLVMTTMDGVLLPAMAEEQNRKERLREMTRRAIMLGSFLVMPAMAGFAACAEPLVRLAVTAKWLPTVPYLRIFCIIYAFTPMHLANLNAIKAVGESGTFLILEIIKRGIEAVVLIITVRYGPYAMALGLLCSELASLGINAWPNGRILDYSWMQQMKDILPTLLLSLIMAAGVYAISLLSLPDILILLIQIPLGVGIYVLGSRLMKLESFAYVMELLSRLRKRGKEPEQ